MEAIYENGILKDYKQIMQDISSNGEKEWIISDRINEGDYNSGISKIYSREDDYMMEFNFSNVTLDNVLTVNDYIEKIENSDNVIQTGYYCGRTSNGYYNDDTGNAYIIKYFPDETIRILYVGNFVDGKFNERTDNAWYITKEINTGYMYYKGYFGDNDPLNNSTSYFEGPSLSIDRINEILEENNFKKELNWY